MGADVKPFLSSANIAISVGAIMDACSWEFETRGEYSTGETAADGNADIVVHANHV